MVKQINWQKGFQVECLKTPGQHILIIGITGSGKTTAQFWVLDGIIKASECST